MAKLHDIFKCEVCGQIVEVVHEGVGQLVCCQKPMTKLLPKNRDEGQEKHVPVIEKLEKGYKVKVGSIAHPMEENHYIEWIELIADGESHRKFLKPGEVPAVVFRVGAEKVSAREYCNLHGLWTAS